MQKRYQQIRRVTLIGAMINTLLAITKLVFGWLGSSHALLADGIHSFSDLLTDGLVIMAAKFSSADADSDHPYGHARIETAASLGLALFLMLLGLAIVFDAGEHLWLHQQLAKPHAFVLWFAFFSIVANEGLYRYTHYIGKKIGSDLLLANALHSRGDAASSLVVFAGVIGSLLGFVYLDSVAAIIVGFLIIKMGWYIGWQNIRELIDTGLDQSDLKAINHVIFSIPGVKSVHDLRSRKMAGQALLDVHIIVDSHITVSEGHHIGECVMQALKQQVAVVEDVVVHIDSEHDEQYSSTSRLPLRDVLIPQLEKAWRDLPGFTAANKLRLHYLAGTISVEVELPLALLDTPQDTKALRQQYQAAAEGIDHLGDITLYFF